MFTLHPTLARDTVQVTDWPLCRVLLMNERRCPWLILVPQQPGLREIHDLSETDRTVVMMETTRASQALVAAFSPDKINIGALGNVVEQLHVHVVARFCDDFAWPGPIWGKDAPHPYDEQELADVLLQIRIALG
ncbi:MAG: HIT family protein [Rhodospirillales bacterium]|nr:HIT family protein [Rhodospirillales bacterium]MCW8862514.1 HIT family protein [Rhodospirillales bacterium]MCW8951068.1 HIT family protein [Rhodospirillales bacterium]MCW8970120.1 HIT family protein [Rhodospirillales bacterium]MCW9002365.1 HIT family protein [Rhodospirillales bacterium]